MEATARDIQRLGDRLLALGQTLALAESCTGGLIAKLLTDQPGSSGWFERAAITYSNLAKQQMLGVPPEVLERQGAVSQACAEAMVRGLLVHSPADWGIAVTGVAGPGGGSPDKPVGTVWIAWLRRGAAPQAQRFLFPGARAAVRAATAVAALRGLQERLATP